MAWAVEEAAASGGGVMVSCSDQSLDTVIGLARHAQAIGADYIVVHTPLLYFGSHQGDYVRELAERIEQSIKQLRARSAKQDSNKKGATA